MPTASTDTDALRVLVVDDSAPLRERVCVALTLAGLTVVGEACDGAHALVQAAQQHPDVILMDVSMPGMDGIQATRALRHRHPETRVVLWSGDSDDQLADAVDRKSTRLNSSHVEISYAVFCLKKKKQKTAPHPYKKKQYRRK